MKSSSKTVGDSSDYAEIIIDYAKRKTKIIGIQDNKEIKDLTRKQYVLEPNPSVFSVILLDIMTIIYILVISPTPSIISSLLISILSIMLAFSFYFLMRYFTYPHRKKLHKLTQDFLTGISLKKYAVFRDINTKIWKFPYEFGNNKFDYKLYGDYKKYIQKVHIKPLDYKEFRFKKKKEAKQQNEKWEVYFYFSRIPKKGRMEIIFI